MKLENLTPPRLPNQWSTSFVSYWQPMLEDDQMTSGYCWFDHIKQICRIDGLFNPWSEKETGHRLWMSEIGNASMGKTIKYKVAYTREGLTQEKGGSYFAKPLPDGVDEFNALFITQDALIDNEANFGGYSTVLGVEVEAWSFMMQGKGKITLYFMRDTNHLVRMITGDPEVHASVRDFPNFNTQDIPSIIFNQGPTS